MKISEEIKNKNELYHPSARCPDWVMEKVEALEQQIEAMKCCNNCENVTDIFDAISGNFRNKEACDTCEDNSNWELKQDK